MIYFVITALESGYLPTSHVVTLMEIQMNAGELKDTELMYSLQCELTRLKHGDSEADNLFEQLLLQPYKPVQFAANRDDKMALGLISRISEIKYKQFLTTNKKEEQNG